MALTAQDYTGLLPVNRGSSTSETMARKTQEAFEGQKFTILGAIHLPMGEVYQTPMGSTGRHGFLLRNDDSGEKVVIGRQLLLKIERLYGCVDLSQLDNLRQVDLS
jgi:hypothetical protein